MSGQPTIWGLHHNRGRPIVEKGVAAIGWEEAGDLTALPDDREAFKARLRETYAHKTENWVANAAGQLRRFRHVMAVGDLIVFPRPVDRTINIGRITGEYLYDTGRWGGGYPNQRPVDWLKTALPRDTFTQGVSTRSVGSGHQRIAPMTRADRRPMRFSRRVSRKGV